MRETNKQEEVILSEYTDSGRQYAIYVVDCSLVECSLEMREAAHNINKYDSDKINVRFYTSDDTLT